jgi:hypothetical protein
MMNARRNSPSALRFAERRRREDEAPRLGEQVPGLLSLRLDIEERADAGGNTHTRHVVVGRAPAIFLIPCGDPRCTDGEHDLTSVVMRALRTRETSFRGEDECRGMVGTSASACTRMLRFEGTAAYAR